MTADPPRKLALGDHFDLARDVSDALENKIAFEHRDSLHGHLFPDDLGRIADAFDAAAEILWRSRGVRAVPSHVDRL